MIISHTFPGFVIDAMKEDSHSKNCSVSRFLDEVYNLVQPKLWIGGHLHVNKELFCRTKFICHYKAPPECLKNY